MAWRKLPPRLQGRVRTPEVLGSLVALVATPVFGVIWLFGPPALAVLFVAREQWLLAGVAIPLALWWAYQMVKDPTVIGLLVSVPYGAWSLVQQWRGRVDTLDLEDGRYVGLADWRAPTARERAVLELLVSAVPDLPQLRPQIAQAEVRAECVCGCPSIILFPTAPAVPRDAAYGNARGERDELAVAATGPGDVEVVLRLHLGNVRELEVTTGGGHDGTPAELPDASALRLRDDDRRPDEAAGA